MADYGYVDVGKLADYANNSTVGLTANDIMRFPRADVQPVKRGRWIYKGTVNSWDEMACSCCDEAFSTQDREQILNWEFCPHCGARMDGDETIKG